MAHEDDDIEFIPTDEDDQDDERGGAEEDAVHAPDDEEELEQLAEAEGIDIGEHDEGLTADVEAEAEEEADRAEDTEEAEEEAADIDETELDEDREEDLGEILHRHYGLVEEPTEPEEGEEAEAEATGPEPRGPLEEEPRPLGSGEFVCRSCFLRKNVSQLADPDHQICADCAADAA